MPQDTRALVTNAAYGRRDYNRVAELIHDESIGSFTDR